MMRADAKQNYEHILSVAEEFLTGGVADVSLRDIARKAGVGNATLHRHFPTREALFEALLRKGFDALSLRAAELLVTDDAKGALVIWLREAASVTCAYRGVISPMVAAIADEHSALHDSCVGLRTAGTRLLSRAQAEGLARKGMDGNDLFALISALAWLAEQPPLVPHADNVFGIIADGIFIRG
ncbi:TetR family transcriptional regulator (plasmid) [Rahnella sikkimica]|uniref:TetR family transcriptional regulator n=2 Tax=Rahnella sikkimica TaxID=1805933 RepID=A0A2L1UXR1_9GAMM|nr:TetR family transcriptional regulator [Rahnella sikkimica]